MGDMSDSIDWSYTDEGEEVNLCPFKVGDIVAYLGGHPDVHYRVLRAYRFGNVQLEPVGPCGQPKTSVPTGRLCKVTPPAHKNREIQVGDFVRLKSTNGAGRVYEVIRLVGAYLKVRSTSSGVVYTRIYHDYELATDYQPQQEKETKEMTDQLYEIKVGNKILYGTKLTHDSSGNWVMELKGDGGVSAFKPEQCEKVMPHTIAVSFIGETRMYHFLCPKDKVEVGECFFIDGYSNFCTVREVDTKSEKATATFRPFFKLQGEAVESKGWYK